MVQTICQGLETHKVLADALQCAVSANNRQHADHISQNGRAVEKKILFYRLTKNALLDDSSTTQQD